jgi:hypothetical protein
MRPEEYLVLQQATARLEKMLYSEDSTRGFAKNV